MRRPVFLLIKPHQHHSSPLSILILASVRVCLQIRHEAGRTTMWCDWCEWAASRRRTTALQRSPRTPVSLEHEQLTVDCNPSTDCLSSTRSNPPTAPRIAVARLAEKLSSVQLAGRMSGTSPVRIEIKPGGVTVSGKRRRSCCRDVKRYPEARRFEEVRYGNRGLTHGWATEHADD